MRAHRMCEQSENDFSFSKLLTILLVLANFQQLLQQSS